MSKELSDFEAGRLVQSVENIEDSVKKLQECVSSQNQAVNRRISKIEKIQNVITGGVIIVPTVIGFIVAVNQLIG